MRQIGPRVLMLLATMAAFLKVALPEGVSFMEGIKALTGQDWMAMVGAMYLTYTSPTQIKDAATAVKNKVT